MPTNSTTFSSGVVVGNLARDPELRQTKAGVPVCNFSLVIDDQHSNDQGDGERGHYIDFVCYGSLASNVAESLQQGTRVIVVGVLQQERWISKAGVQQRKVSIRADHVGPDLKFIAVEILDT